MKTTGLLIGLFIAFLYSCQKLPGTEDNSIPRAAFTFSPETGDTSVTFTFDASASYDPEQGNDSLLYSWDFSGYNDWTFYTTDRIVTHKFSAPGKYNVGLQVKDKKGWTDMVRHPIKVTR